MPDIREILMENAYEFCPGKDEDNFRAVRIVSHDEQPASADVFAEDGRHLSNVINIKLALNRDISHLELDCGLYGSDHEMRQAILETDPVELEIDGWVAKTVTLVPTKIEIEAVAVTSPLSPYLDNPITFRSLPPVMDRRVRSRIDRLECTLKQVRSLASDRGSVPADVLDRIRKALL